MLSSNIVVNSSVYYLNIPEVGLLYEVSDSLGFFNSLSVPVLNMLLNELLCISKVPPGTKHVDVDLSSLPPTTAMAILLYNRW